MTDPADTAASPTGCATAPVSAGAPSDAAAGTQAKDSHAVLSSAGFGMGSGLIQVLIRTVTSVATSRLLHAENMGLFHLSNRLTKVGSLFSLSGQDDAVVHFVAKHRGTGEFGKARGAFNLSFLFASCLSVLMGVAVWALSPWVLRKWYAEQPVDRLLPLMRALAFVLPATVLGGVMGAALQGSRQVKKSLSAQNIIIPGVRLVLFLAFAAFGWRLFGLVFAVIGSAFLGLLYVGWHVRNRTDWMRPDVVPDYGEWRKVVWFSLPLVLLSLLDYANSSCDVVILGQFRPPADVGVYGQAVNVFTFLKVPISALSALFVPLCAEFYARREMDRMRAMFRATASCGIRIAILAMGGTILLAGPVMSAFGPDFTCGATTLVILSTMVVSNCFAQLGGYAVYMSGRSWLVTLNQLFLTVVCLGLSWPLSQSHGIEGAAIARAVGWAAWAGLILFEAKLLFGFQPFTRDMLKGVVAGGLSFVACRALQAVPLVGGHLVPTLATGVLFVALYVFLCKRFGLTEDERHVLDLLTRKLQKKFVKRPKPA